MEKIKFNDLLQEVSKDAVIKAIKTAKPKHADKTEKELADMLELTDYQYSHLMQKALGDKMSDAIVEKMRDVLVNEEASIELPHNFNLFVHESDVRKTSNGEPVRKLSVRTRAGLKRDIN